MLIFLRFEYRLEWTAQKSSEIIDVPIQEFWEGKDP